MHNDRNLLKDYVYPHLEERKLFLNYSSEAAMFYTIDCESLPDNAPCSRPLPQFVARSPQYTRILTSFHGLVCLGIKKNLRGDFDIILWNPVTTEFKRLSKPSDLDNMECSGRGYGLYYCSGADDYMLLVVTVSCNAYIYSLKSDSWRKLDTKPPFQYYLRPGFCLNQNIYFLSHNITEGSMRFDTKAKRFHKMKNPPVPDGSDSPCSPAITVQKGSIHLCAMYGWTCIMWKFIADEDIWRKLVTYQLLPNNDTLGLYPLHVTSNGNLLMIDHKHGGNRICQVDLPKKKYTKDKKDGHKREDKNKSKGKLPWRIQVVVLYYSDFTVGWPEKVIYTETFVSPNRYMK
ncbi:putative F-box domain-containing protein [Tanacetum coccineum]